MGKQNSESGANLGFESELWKAADALRSNMDAAEYKHVVLGPIFLKYISDAFEEYHAKLDAERDQGADPEDPDEYRAKNIFWVPPGARWPQLQKMAKQTTIGKVVDDAMLAIERDNPSLKGVLPKDYAHPRLDKQRLGQLIDLIGNIGLGDRENRSKDILGRVYEYFLSQFASAEGKKGGQFYTPRCVVQVLVQMLAPFGGRVYDPCCGSGGMFVQSERFIEEHGGKVGDISVYGQESNHTTWRLAKMNDPQSSVGGMAHVMIPRASCDEHPSRRTRYAEDAVEEMMAKMATLGAREAQGHACLVGRANMLGDGHDSPGPVVVRSVTEVLRRKGTTPVAMEVGGTKRRSCCLVVARGRVSYTLGDSQQRVLWEAGAPRCGPDCGGRPGAPEGGKGVKA